MIAALAGWTLAHAGESAQIDRHALVTRHNVTLDKPDPLTPLSVGNGEFAFTADITGLQTFPDYHRKGISLGTLSQWGWHSLPNTEGYTLADAMNCYAVAGREVPYAAGGGPSGGYSPAANWLRANPHRLHLGQIGLRIARSDGLSDWKKADRAYFGREEPPCRFFPPNPRTRAEGWAHPVFNEIEPGDFVEEYRPDLPFSNPATIEDLTETVQTLDLWTGLLASQIGRAHV